MTEGIQAIIYPVKDLAKAKMLYSKILDVEPDLDESYYVNFNIGGQDVGLDPNGHGQGMTGPVGY
jgi:extradiol dioxygenase family protein